MTETLSHIAIRKINGEGASDFYTPLSGVNLKLSDNSTLIIDAPKISDAPIVTNDIVELRDDATFRVIGRVDNIINTGGIKVQAEEVEDTLQPYLKGNYAISSVPHTKLGEAVVLIVDNIDDKYQAEEYVNKILPRYQQPLYIINVESIPMTGNGKIDRKSLKKLAELNIEL
jgi:O-succinylbenzoic acid--CoA ligase